jgi:hypothetical protein
VERHRHVEAVERDVAITAAVDVEKQRHVAEALGRLRGQGSGWRHEARTHHVSAAILEIVTGKVPLDLVRHCSLLLVRNRPVILG